MPSKNPKRKTLIKRIFVNLFMVFSVIVLVTFVTFFMLGFRFDSNNGNLEQNAFLQFSSTPSGATVSIDGIVSGAKTSSKSSVQAGKHTVVMWRDGYQTWQKSVTVKPGTLTWLNYTLLVPKKLTVEPIANYKTMQSSLASPKGNFILVQPQPNIPSYKLIDISSDNVSTKDIVIPASIYSEPVASGVTHTFNIEKWDNGERYAIIKHTYGEKTELIVLDTQDVNQTKNVTKSFNLAIDKAVFSSDGGNSLYVLAAGDIHKLDLNGGTSSKPLVTSVTDFDFYIDSKVITYVGKGKIGTDERVVGLFREGDSRPAVLRTVKGSPDVPLRIATTHYFNENYVAISEGKKVDILSGSYPNTTSDNANSMKAISSFDSLSDVQQLSFSPKGQYVFVQSGASFSSYDLEYQKLSSSTISSAAEVPPLQWLDEYHVWSDSGGILSVLEFDGANAHTINPVLTGQAVTLTNNGRFLYSVNKSATGYQLQRVRMILP
ncbi:MAG: PEGA domain-containing protein [Candidatus Saccharibacteria bacterium]|nr:PEGA domain-containing protein [Candidatus Saccharibacteria bacterium]